MAAADVAFTATPRIQQALQRLRDSKSSLTSEQQQQSVSLPATDSASITMSQLQCLSSLLLALPAPPASATSPAAAPPCRLHELLEHSSLYTPPPPARKRDPAFLAFLNRQRIKQSQREYLSLVKDLPGNSELANAVHASSIASTPVEAGEYTSGFGKAIGREMGEGINILTLMVTGFVVGYYGAGMLWQHSKIAPVAGGLVGLVGAMMLEVTLLMLREQHGEELVAKRKQELKAKSERRVALQRIKDKEAAMQRHMEEMAQQREELQSTEGQAEAVDEATVATEDDGTGVGAATSIRKRRGR